MMKVSVVISKFEDQLVTMNVLPTNSQQLRMFIDKVEMLQGEIPSHEPEFANLDIIFQSSIQEIEIAYKEDSVFLNSDISITGYKNEISSIKKNPVYTPPLINDQEEYKTILGINFNI